MDKSTKSIVTNRKISNKWCVFAFFNTITRAFDEKGRRQAALLKAFESAGKGDIKES